MTDTKRYVYFLIGLIVWIVAIVFAFFPEHLPEQTTHLYESIGRIEGQPEGRFLLAILAGIVIVGSLVKLFVAVKHNPIDRSPIGQTINGTDSSATRVGTRFDDTLENALESVGSLSYRDRHIVVYGRRTHDLDALPIPSDINAAFNELVEAAVRSHAITNNLDVEKARQDIDEGAWTENRIVAAFLATNQETSPTFTVRERFIAWAFPQQTFKNRIRQTLAEIEHTNNEFLTYDAPQIATAPG